VKGDGKLERWEAGALAALLLLALVVRLVGLNASLWYDEVATLTNFVRLPWGELVSDFSSLNNHMFYSLQAKAAVELFGESAWALRLPALLMGMASLILIWWLARKEVGHGAAMVTLFLLALSYHHVWFTQNARGYTGLLTWTTAATILMMSGVRRPRWRVWSLYGLCLAAGMYTHLSAGFFFVAHGVVFAILVIAALLRPRGQIARSYPGVRSIQAYYGFGLGGLLTLLLHLPLLDQIRSSVADVSSSARTSAMAEWNNPLRTLQEFAGSLDALGPVAPYALVGGLLLLILGAVLVWRRSPLLAAIYLTQIPLSLVLLVALSFRIWPRYFFVDIGFVFLCAAVGGLALVAAVEKAVRRTPLRRAVLPAALALMAGFSAVLLARNYAYPKQDFEGAVRLVERVRAPQDVATSAGLAARSIHGYFAPDWPVTENAADLDRLLASGRTVWLITSFQSHTRATQSEIMRRVDSRFDEVAELPGTLGGGYVHVYRSRPVGAAQ
jgi:mannosyltransferase